jgi:hypothetical protein
MFDAHTRTVIQIFDYWNVCRLRGCDNECIGRWRDVSLKGKLERTAAVRAR